MRKHHRRLTGVEPPKLALSSYLSYSSARERRAHHVRRQSAQEQMIVRNFNINDLMPNQHPPHDAANGFHLRQLGHALILHNMLTLGTALRPSATRVLLLGSGELGKEVAIELQRFGVEVIAVDRYANAPAMQVA